VERERHATCLSRANATRRQRRTWCGFAALPSFSRGWGGGEEKGARSARDVLASRDRDAPSAAHMVRPLGAAGPQRRLGRRKRAVSRARYAPPAVVFVDEVTVTGRIRHASKKYHEAHVTRIINMNSASCVQLAFEERDQVGLYQQD